jgi:2-aminoethylphosphonate transport system substrate-binding protein
MSQVLSRTTTKRCSATVLAGGLLFASLTACASTKSKASGASTGAGKAAPAAGSCPALGATPPSAPAPTKGHVSVYSADGLMNTTDENNWYNKEFKKFEDLTGVHVDYVEGGSGEVESKVVAAKSHQLADVLVTLPPFIQIAASEGVLETYTPVCADKIDKSLVDPNGQWEAVMGNYADFIYNSKLLSDNPPKTWNDLLDPKFKQKLQYSTPGVAGDGTAVMIKAIHDFGGDRTKAFAYFTSLQPNNLGLSSSTGKLEPKVNNGDILVANGDVQMNYVDAKNSFPNNKIFFPAGADGAPTTFSLPYMAGVVKGGPNTENGKKLVDFLLSEQSQLDTSAIAYGFPSRTDIKPTDANYSAISALLQGVTVFPVDWTDVAKHYKDDVAGWKKATGNG